MSRPPSKHGLERKYKPWRKGQSKIAKAARLKAAGEDLQSQNISPALTKGGSLKNQLRSQRRLLAKLTKAQNDGSSDDNGQKEKTEKQRQVEERIQQIEEALAERDRNQREKNNATKYHQVKFFERQKLTRMERKIRKKLQEAKEAADFEDIDKITTELQEVGFNQLYVAYFPNRLKYISIFSDNSQDEIEKEDRFGDAKALQKDRDENTKRRLEIREDILNNVRSGKIDCTKSWVNMELIKNLLDSYSSKRIKVEVGRQSKNTVIEKNSNTTTFQKDEDDDECVETKSSATNKQKESTEPKKKKIKVTDVKSEEVDVMESKSNSKDINVGSPDDDGGDNSGDSSGDSSNSNSSDSSSGDSSSCVSSSTDGDSDSDEDKDTHPQSLGNTMDEQNKNSHDDLQEDVQEEKTAQNEDEESDDDFFADGDADETNTRDVFANASTEIHTHDEFANGDKSKGWATQKLRPGEWRGKKRRR